LARYRGRQHIKASDLDGSIACMSHWHDTWRRIFEIEPYDKTSHEVCVQEVQAQLILGRRAAWFIHYPPTDRGQEWLRRVWQRAFPDTPIGQLDWFTSEIELIVPDELRDRITRKDGRPYTYRCPDFGALAGDRLLIIELKTLAISYDAQQIQHYFDLARYHYPHAHIDVILLGPHLPRGAPTVDERQRYAELSWADVPAINASAFPGDPRAARLAEFLAAVVLPLPVAEPPTAPVDRIEAAVFQALRIAPALNGSTGDKKSERGIDVAFAGVDEARAAERAIRAALTERGLDKVTTWLWRPRSLGPPRTDAGAEVGFELRLAPAR
jgi:hypothetical protein